MNTIPGKFYILHTLNTIFGIDPLIEALPVIWNRDGEYRIIPREAVENAVDILSMYTVFDGKRTQPTPVILWSQGIPISNLAGRALIGE